MDGCNWNVRGIWRKIDSLKLSPSLNCTPTIIYSQLLLFWSSLIIISWYRLHFLFVLWCILFIISIIIIQLLSIHNHTDFYSTILQHRAILATLRNTLPFDVKKVLTISWNIYPDIDSEFFSNPIMMLPIYLKYIRSTGWIFTNLFWLMFAFSNFLSCQRASFISESQYLTISRLENPGIWHVTKKVLTLTIFLLQF